MSLCRLSMNSSSLFKTMLESKGERILPWGVPILDLSNFPFSSMCPTFSPLSIKVRVLEQDIFSLIELSITLWGILSKHLEISPLITQAM